MLPIRVQTYLVARQHLVLRTDAKRRLKTSGTVKCEPPNKKCGGRCIPPTWNCRITGGGLDSHSRVVQFDPVKGTASLIRGAKNVKEGVRKGDPEKVARGLGGIERGIVKVTPGSTIEDKQRFRKRVKAVVTTAFLASVTGIAAYKSHQAMKRGFKGYRNGLGADIDNAARVGVERAADLWDAGVDRAGLGGLFGTGRAAARAGGQGAMNRLAYQGVVSRAADNRLAFPAQRSRLLASRARLRAPGVGMAEINDLDITARTQNWSFDQWEARKLHAFYDLKTPTGKSAFAQPAAHELLARQWGFSLPPRSERMRAGSPGSLNDEISRVRDNLLPSAVGDMHRSMKEDLTRRGFAFDRKGINAYIDRMLEENASLVNHPSKGQRERLQRQMRERMTSILNASDTAKQRSLARSTYNNTVDFYDSYFKDMASRLAVDDNGKPAYNILNPDSPYTSARIGLARVHMAQRVRYSTGTGVRTGGRRFAGNVPDGDAAYFLNRYYYHTHVQRRRSPYAIKNPKSFVNYAQQISGESFSTTQAALDWMRSNGYDVTIGNQRKDTATSNTYTESASSHR